jgi:hypothetical protein
VNHPATGKTVKMRRFSLSSVYHKVVLVGGSGGLDLSVDGTLFVATTLFVLVFRHSKVLGLEIDFEQFD